MVIGAIVAIVGAVGNYIAASRRDEKQRGDAEVTGLEAFRQSDRVRDYIFPLCVAAGDPGTDGNSSGFSALGS